MSFNILKICKERVKRLSKLYNLTKEQEHLLFVGGLIEVINNN